MLYLQFPIIPVHIVTAENTLLLTLATQNNSFPSDILTLKRGYFSPSLLKEGYGCYFHLEEKTVQKIVNATDGGNGLEVKVASYIWSILAVFWTTPVLSRSDWLIGQSLWDEMWYCYSIIVLILPSINTVIVLQVVLILPRNDAVTACLRIAYKILFYAIYVFNPDSLEVVQIF